MPRLRFPCRAWRLAGACLLAVAALRGAAPASERTPFAPAKLAAMDSAIQDAIAARKTPGGVLWLERDGTSYHKAYGQRALSPAAEPISEDTIYDAASLTKVIATTTAVMRLVERGKLNLDATATSYLPWFTGGGKEKITLRQLLSHVSGLRPDVDTVPAWSGHDTGIRLVAAEKVRSLAGSAFVYSDINFIVLGELVRAASGKPLETYVAEEVFGPLKMTDTGFLPPKSKLARIAPTELTNGEMLRGVVHDPTTRYMGGVAGHAGLFTTAADLARFCRMIVNGGELDGVRILKTETILEMTRAQTDGSDRRGLGWDIDTRFSGPRGRWFPAGRTFGHTGFTGTSLWLDPATKSFVIFMGNRVHPDGKGDVAPLRRLLGTLAAEAMGRDVGATLNGIDVLVRDRFAPLRGLRIGLITNHSGRDREGRATIDVLHGAEDVKLTALFSPEHGIRGNADAKVNDSIDERTKLPVYSLYGESPKRPTGMSAADYDQLVLQARAPKPEQLKDLDALVFDIQDVGARFYTYSATLGVALEAAAKAKKKFIVLDRVSPTTAAHVEGPVMTRSASFVGYHPVPTRHGMTLGELARMYNAEKKLGADLVVIRVENWQRGQWYDETGLPWITPSPALKNVTSATLYPGLCLLEGTALSMGRGTLTPFEQVGAPFVDGVALAAEMNAAGLPGLRFEPTKFTPVAELYPGPVSTLKHHDKECGGVRVILTDRDRANMVDMGIVLALAMNKLYAKDAKLDDMAKLLGDDATLAAIKAGKPLAEIKAGWAKGLAEFEARRKAVALY